MELDRVKALHNPANQPDEILGLYSFAKTSLHLTYSYSEQDCHVDKDCVDGKLA